MMSTLLNHILPLWITLAIALSLLWFALRGQNKYEVVDAFWALSLGASAIVICLISKGDENRRWLMGSITTLWALRLGVFLYWGRIKKGLSDGRYENWVKVLGNKVDIKMFWFFQLQAFSVVLLSITFMAVCSTTHAIGLFDILGVVLFIVSLIGEWYSDNTLNQFRLNPLNKGKVCNQGPWRLCRHPNYFFEWLHWLSYPMFCMGSFPELLLSFTGPLFLLILILKVSGIPLTEAQAIRSRGQAYKVYQQTTPAFFPFILRKKNND